MAAVGFGLETPARRFKLDFIPLAAECYFLLCRRVTLVATAMQPLLDMLRSDAFRAELDALPGYSPDHIGRVTPLREAFGAAAAGR